MWTSHLKCIIGYCDSAQTFTAEIWLSSFYGGTNALVDKIMLSSNALYPQKLALTSPTSGGRSVGIVRSRTQATEFAL
jgi:hypothetical protein